MNVRLLLEKFLLIALEPEHTVRRAEFRRLSGEAVLMTCSNGFCDGMFKLLMFGSFMIGPGTSSTNILYVRGKFLLFSLEGISLSFPRNLFSGALIFVTSPSVESLLTNRRVSFDPVFDCELECSLGRGPLCSFMCS